MLKPEPPKSVAKSAAKYLSAALGHLNHDRFDRFSDNNDRPSVNGVIAALHLNASEAEELMMQWMPKNKQGAELVKKDETFKQYMADMYKLVNNEAVPFTPIDIEKYYPDFVKNPNVVDYKPWESDDGSLVNCQEWSLYNQQRMAQHKFTILLCSELLRESFATKYALTDLASANLWAHQKQAQFKNTYMKLVLLEGNIEKIQMLREQLMEKTIGANQMISHLYSRLEQDSGGSTSKDDRLRQEIISSVQTPIASYGPSMNDLGL